MIKVPHQLLAVIVATWPICSNAQAGLPYRHTPNYWYGSYYTSTYSASGSIVWLYVGSSGMNHTNNTSAPLLYRFTFNREGVWANFAVKAHQHKLSGFVRLGGKDDEGDHDFLMDSTGILFGYDTAQYIAPINDFYVYPGQTVTMRHMVHDPVNPGPASPLSYNPTPELVGIGYVSTIIDVEIAE